MSDYPKVYIHKHPKASKEHKCHECEGIIFSGETYHNHFGIWENGPESFKVCVDCDKLRDKIESELHGGDQICLGELHEFVFNGGEVEDIRTFLKIKEKRRAKIEKWMVDDFDRLFNKEENEN
ncbi:MAG: hypothetical protein NTZ48_06250 [Candidatus Omnitrophica bacterium]|nr:hypothetical protein [Candidatus Omnitrophota bacterium]